MRSVYDNVTVGGIVGPITATTAAAVATNGAVIDTKGFNSACIRVFLTPTRVITGLAAALVSTMTVVLQESAATDSTASFATANDNSGTAIGGTVTATAAAVISSFRVEGLGQNRLRFLRVRITPFLPTTRGNDDNVFTAVAIIELSRAYQRPVIATTSNT